MVKKQQMGWSQRGAHLLLQIRTRVLDQEWESTFRRWYPDFRPQAQGQAKKRRDPLDSPALHDLDNAISFCNAPSRLQTVTQDLLLKRPFSEETLH
jgi:hypothetical protein